MLFCLSELASQGIEGMVRELRERLAVMVRIVSRSTHYLDIATSYS
jgi:hypothetical protein